LHRFFIVILTKRITNSDYNLQLSHQSIIQSFDYVRILLIILSILLNIDVVTSLIQHLFLSCRSTLNSLQCKLFRVCRVFIFAFSAFNRCMNRNEVIIYSEEVDFFSIHLILVWLYFWFLASRFSYKNRQFVQETLNMYHLRYFRSNVSESKITKSVLSSIQIHFWQISLSCVKSRLLKDFVIMTFILSSISDLNVIKSWRMISFIINILTR